MKDDMLLLLGAGVLALWWLSGRRTAPTTTYAAPGNIVAPPTTPPVGTQPVYTPQVAQAILTDLRSLRPDGYLTPQESRVYVDALASTQGITATEMQAQEAAALGGGESPTNVSGALPNSAVTPAPTLTANAPSYFGPGYAYALGPSQQELQALGVV